MHKKTQEEIFALCDKVRETAFALHVYLRHGHLEKVYENGLANRLSKQGIAVSQQESIEVRDEDGTEHGLLINFGAPKLQVRKFVLSQALEPTNQSDA